MLAGKPFSHFFYIRNASGVTSPDASPTCTLILNGIDSTVAVSVTATVDGGWMATGSIPGHWVEGDFVHLRISATASGYLMTDTTLLGEISSPGLTISEIVDAIEDSEVLAKESTARAARNAAIANL